MLLYIHVPFCKKRCAYCAFYSQTACGAENLDAFTDSLLKEMSFWHSKLGSKNIDSIFFGGGTPSLLSPHHLEKILSQGDALFSLEKGIEITLEANPESAIRGTWLSDLRSLGVNRISLGVQSFFSEDLDLLGRLHNKGQAEELLERIKNLGFIISLDLMSGLPIPVCKKEEQKSFYQGRAKERGESFSFIGNKNFDINWDFPRRWLLNLEKALSFEPDHISTYALSLEENTPLAEGRGSFIFPREEDQREIYLQGISYLKNKGFEHYEVSNFAREGFKCQHNLGYWEGKDYLGLGPSAVSTIKAKRWENIPDFGAWVEGIKEGQPVIEKENLSHEIILEEKLMLSLRLAQGLDLEAWQKMGGKDLEKSHKDFIEALYKEGLAVEEENFLKLTDKGFLLADSIISQLL